VAKRKRQYYISKSRSRKSGMPPGTMVHTAEVGQDSKGSHITILSFNETDFEEFENARLEDYHKLAKENRITWIHVEGLETLSVIQEIGQQFDVHPLTLEDIVNTDQRPKFEEYNKYDALILKTISYKNELFSEQLSILLFDSLIISFEESKECLSLKIIRDRLRQNKGRVRRSGADYLAYAILDAVIDNYFNVLEVLGDKLELFEEELGVNHEKDFIRRIYEIKREVIYLRKLVWPLREIISGFDRSGSARLNEGTRIYLRDANDHATRVIETVENFRDLIAGIMDVHLSSLSHKMNEVMKVLTIISTIFIPVTFVVGVYGMNFENMPELTSSFGYPLVWIIMVVMMGSMFYYFKRKNWL
jgi:magnesium transporter